VAGGAEYSSINREARRIIVDDSVCRKSVEGFLFQQFANEVSIFFAYNASESNSAGF
jgi:hypothetical protein